MWRTGHAASGSRMRPSELLSVANRLVTGGDTAGTAGWQRTAAVLGRQAIEETLRLYWQLREPGLERCSTHAQLLCLRVYLDNTDLAQTTAAAWSDLSRACHHHPYEINPTAIELRAWLQAADRFAGEVTRQVAAAGRRGRDEAPGD